MKLDLEQENERLKTALRQAQMEARKMSTLEEFRQDIIDMMYASIMAERDACIRVALEEVGGPTAKLVADKIRARPAPQFPPLSFGLKDVVIASLVPQTGVKK